ncbi:uncharacterized protein LOC130966758 [Arachis stenosperma]|uniref:uncharacterized protein LOC130966758 n=1 Tax=Arachis stenosperma TaxID=217475 RepID=UPI0025AC42BD|nr:uncharacterized protein LOC130966758 [Arachis stenosperma]
MDFTKTVIARKLQVEELECLRMDAYENARIYKEKTKTFHDHHICNKNFQEDDEFLLYNSRPRFMPGKLHSRCDGPFKVKEVKPTEWLNGHKMKKYHGYKSPKKLEAYLLEDAPVGEEF